MRGRFITVEGIEGVGKSTIVPFVQQKLEAEGRIVHVTREPGGTKLAEAVRDLLLSDWAETILPQTELLLMFASRAQHVSTVIEPTLQAGTDVVCERFTDASMAYQGGGRGIEDSFIESLAQLTHGETSPDLTLYLDLDVEESSFRTQNRRKDRIEQEDLDFFQRVRNAYRKLASKHQRIVTIDASRSLQEVESSVATALAGLNK
ncbi:MAG: dTMP kinase [Gammaproteobacteria bacterium]|nr:dTMP kinase [Gammaproteobacteria bacterium]